MQDGKFETMPDKYIVDSEMAFDRLSKAKPGDYQAALGDMVGWFVLTWRDSRNDSIYILNWNGEMRFRNVGGQYLYSSSGFHLATAIGYDTSVEVKNGEVFRFTREKSGSIKCKQLKDFIAKQRPVQKSTYTGNYLGRGVVNQGITSVPYRYARPGTDENDPTGWVRLFNNGCWYAELFSQRFVYVKCQDEINKKYPNVDPANGRRYYGAENIKGQIPPHAKRHTTDPNEVLTISDDEQGEIVTLPVDATGKVEPRLLSEDEQEKVEKAKALADFDAVNEQLDRARREGVDARRQQRIHYLKMEMGYGDEEINACLEMEGLGIMA